jgi:glycerate-2-kinase
MPITNWQTLVSHGNQRGREHALRIIEAGLAAADPYEAIRRMVRIEGRRLIVGGAEFEPAGAPERGEQVFDLETLGRILVLGAGKGVQRAALALEHALGERLTGGHVVDKKGGDAFLQRIEVTLGGHPTPDADGVRGCQRILELTADLRPEDLVFTLGSSGFSSLLTLPAPGVSLEDVQRTVYAMQIERGMPTSDLSPVRNHLDQLKGGQLAARIHPAQAVHILCKPPAPWEQWIYHNSWVHSFPDCSTFADAIAMLKKWHGWEAVPASVRAWLERADPAYETIKPEQYLKLRARLYGAMPGERGDWAAPRRVAEELGYQPVLLATGLDAEAAQAGRTVAAIANTVERLNQPFSAPVALITGGELLVTVGEELGIGGRNQEYVLAAALKIAGSQRIVVAAVDTDGTDGPGAQYTDLAGQIPTLAGGIADGATVAAARARGVDLREALRRHNTTPALLALDSAILATQNTGLLDLGVVLVMGR